MSNIGMDQSDEGLGGRTGGGSGLVLIYKGGVFHLTMVDIFGHSSTNFKAASAQSPLLPFPVCTRQQVACPGCHLTPYSALAAIYWKEMILIKF